MANLPRVAILGRPNVGKSTLFNRICGRRRALVGNEPGMTRDRLYSPAEWQGKSFEVVDTGGMVPAEKELIPSEIFRQAGVAIDEAAHLILVVDARAGVVPLDEELAQMLRRTGKPLSLAVNKIDSLGQAPLAAEFHRLGVREIFPVGRGRPARSRDGGLWERGSPVRFAQGRPDRRGGLTRGARGRQFTAPRRWDGARGRV
ncbi:MAG: hypothetical protein DMG27_21255 [Acidobacteria bacterium]|nr:MAG: hypothetical protein DMG27_21255 [Acidobacteriota bacterium]